MFCKITNTKSLVDVKYHEYQTFLNTEEERQKPVLTNISPYGKYLITAKVKKIFFYYNFSRFQDLLFNLIQCKKTCEELTLKVEN